MGKSCIRFKKLDQLPLETISRLIAKTSVKDFIEATKALVSYSCMDISP